MSLTIAALAALVLPAQVAGEPSSLCEEALAAVPSFSACAATPYGVGLAETPEGAERLAAYVKSGEVAFTNHFGRPPPRYVIAYSPPEGALSALRSAGFVAALPWLPPEQMAQMADESVRRGHATQAAAQGLSPEAAAAALQALLDRTATSRSVEGQLVAAANIVPHEIGHLWFTSAFWPNVATTTRHNVAPTTRHYGGPSPDWLDETAAILIEPPALADSRRQQFQAVYRGDARSAGIQPLASISIGALIDLEAFLTLTHPTAGALDTHGPRATAPSSPSRSGVSVLSGPEAVALAQGGLQFYLQSRVFADYLIEKSGPAVFGEIGQAFADGEDIGSWLARAGPANGLPTSIQALDADWRRWLISRYGPPADPGVAPG